MGQIQLAAGRELDALIAEKVMGLQDVRNDGWPSCLAENGRSRRGIPSYSTDIAAAWQVVERMRETGHVVIVEALHAVNGDGDHWRAQIYQPYKHCGETWEGTIEVAICLAALKAVEDSHV